jgi:S-layer protein (TIGR01564 family)
MQRKKVARKIAAITTGALMLGATLGGAFALGDLADYPAPFVADGVLDNTVIVVGKTAETSDVLGAIDIAAALQAAAVSQEAVSTVSSVAPTISEGVKVQKSGNKMNYNDYIYTVMAEPLDSNDLPDMLVDGTFDDNEGTNKGEDDYDQELQFNTTAFQLLLTQPDDMAAGTYLQLAKNAVVYEYTLQFDTAVSFASAAVSTDLEGNTIDIQGNTYTITEASVASGVLDKLVLVAGDSTVWLTQDQPYTVGGHTVTVVDVNNDADKCGVNVDGVTKWVDKGTTEEFGDLSVGILDAVAVYTRL